MIPFKLEAVMAVIFVCWVVRLIRDIAVAVISVEVVAVEPIICVPNVVPLRSNAEEIMG